MGQLSLFNASKCENQCIGIYKKKAADGGTMPPEERREAVLEFMADHGIALPPKAIFRGMKVERNILFSYRTVQTILSELEEKGFVARVNKEALDEGNIEPIPEEESGRRAYYMITMDGRREIDQD